MTDLLPLQKEAVEKMLHFLKTSGGVYNASEMGTGKSNMTLSTIDLLPDIKCVLIICPAVVKLVWEAQAQLWKKRDYVMYCISYDEARNKTHLWEKIDYDCLVLDEAHKVKNIKTAQTRAVLTKLWPNAKYKICLSGTPMTRSITDLWTLFSRLAPDVFNNWFKFVNTYSNPVKTPWGMNYEGVRNVNKLRAIIREKFFVRYELAEMQKDLPEKIWQKIPLGIEYKHKLTEEEEEKHERYLELLKDAYIAVSKTDSYVKPPRPPISIATSIRKQGLKKVPAIVEFSKNILDTESPLVLFLYHTEVVEACAKALDKYNPVFITGGTSAKNRQEAVRKFESGETNLFVANIAAASTGISLYRGTTIVFGELSWNPADIEQASSRSLRINQKNTINVYYFIVQNSVDERIADVLVAKAKIFKQVLNGKS